MAGGLNYKGNKGIQHLGDGVNSGLSPFYIKKSESMLQSNCFVDKYPEMTSRHGFALFNNPSATIWGAGAEITNTFHAQLGTDWKMWSGTTWSSAIASSLTAQKCVFIHFSTAAKNYIIMSNKAQKKYWDYSTVSDLTCPATLLFAIDDFRMYAALGNTLYWTSLGDPTNWSTGDSSSVLLASSLGSAMAITKFGQDQIVVFTLETMHILYGDNANDFYQSDPIYNGCLTMESLTNLNGVLYFLDYRRLKMYSGGVPVDVPGQEKVQYYLNNMYIVTSQIDTHVMTSFDKYILLSIPMSSPGTSNDTTLVFDTVLGIWHVWTKGFKKFLKVNDGANIKLLGVSTDNKLLTISDRSQTGDENTSFAWYWITGCFNEGILSSKKVLTAIWVQFYYVLLRAGDTFKLAYVADEDGSSFTDIKTFSSSTSVQTVRVDVQYLNIVQDFFRLKFYGTGQCKIKGYELEYRVVK